jgi:hypothetical protein
MYLKQIESDSAAMKQHNDNMKANASRRLGDNVKGRKHSNTCAPGTPNRKMEAARDARIADYERMLAGARPNEDHSGYKKPGSFTK